MLLVFSTSFVVDVIHNHILLFQSTPSFVSLWSKAFDAFYFCIFEDFSLKNSIVILPDFFNCVSAISFLWATENSGCGLHGISLTHFGWCGCEYHSCSTSRVDSESSSRIQDILLMKETLAIRPTKWSSTSIPLDQPNGHYYYYLCWLSFDFNCVLIYIVSSVTSCNLDDLIL